MAAANHRTGGSEGGDVVSDTPRIDNERDALQKTTLRLMDEKIAAEKQLSASQQEARRLREALQRAMYEYDNGGKCWHSNEVAGAMRAALASTPAPVHKDTERLNFCDTMIDLAPGFYVLRFPVTESCTIRDAIDAELARND